MEDRTFYQKFTWRTNVKELHSEINEDLLIGYFWNNIVVRVLGDKFIVPLVLQLLEESGNVVEMLLLDSGVDSLDVL